MSPAAVAAINSIDIFFFIQRYKTFLVFCLCYWKFSFKLVAWEIQNKTI